MYDEILFAFAITYFDKELISGSDDGLVPANFSEHGFDEAPAAKA
jgi:hypothetical protein